MNTKCKGIVGKLFGHNFKSHLIKIIPQDIHMESFKGSLYAYNEMMDRAKENAAKEYKIVCTRCGQEK